MTQEELMVFHKEFLDKMHQITKAKNADYTGGGDAFKNFEGVETTGCVDTAQGFITRMWDKYMRICSFVKNGDLQVKDEVVEDTLMDLSNYCVLMAGWIKSRKGEGA